VIAIAEYSGESQTKTKMVRILSCPDKSLVGREWFILGIPETEGDFFIILFDPQDQFCRVFPLEDIDI
jgi:hypothetical protein